MTRPIGAASGHGIQYKPLSNGSFTYGERGSDGWRYLYAAFKVRNVASNGDTYNASQNITFLAVDTGPSASAGETYAHTAVDVMLRFNGHEPDNAENLAKKIIPTGRVALNNAGELESFGPDVLQVFSEDEVQAFEDKLSIYTDVNDIFPYGFIVRSPEVTPGSRSLPSLSGDPRPIEEQYDGIVTFAFKIPLQAVANEDPLK